MADEERKRIIEMQDQLLALSLQKKEAREANDWHRLFVIQIAINHVNVEMTEQRRHNPVTKR